MLVCLADLFSSWNWQIRRRSSSVRIRRGVDTLGTEDALVGVGAAGVDCDGRMGTGWGMDSVGGSAGDRVFSGKLDRVVSMLGHGCDSMLSWKVEYGCGTDMLYAGSMGMMGGEPWLNPWKSGSGGL